MRWRPCYPYFLISAICFFAAAGSAVVDRLGKPMVFAFATLCSVFLTFGALASKERAPASDRDSEGAP